LPSATFVGEIGLDASPEFYHSFGEQERIFTTILAACAKSGRRILSLHSVRCAPRVLKHVEDHLSSDRARVVFHWFTGSPADAKKAIRLGCYFSINSAMLASSKARALIQGLPKDRLLTETDGPFVHVNNGPARPSNVPESVVALAELLGMTREATAALIIENWRTIEGFATD
jgi:TatD DNase family protein